MSKSTVDQIRERFDGDVERFSNLETGQSATIDAPLSLALIAEAATRVTPRARSLLDVGCGAGNYTLKVLERLPNLDVTLIDLSRPMLDRAVERVSRATSGRVTALQGDVRELQIGEGRYDIICAAAVLHHLRETEEWRNVFSKFHQSLRAGGSIWISDLIEHTDARVQALNGANARPSAMALAWTASKATSAGLGLSVRSFQPRAQTTAPPATCTTGMVELGERVRTHAGLFYTMRLFGGDEPAAGLLAHDIMLAFNQPARAVLALERPGRAFAAASGASQFLSGFRGFLRSAGTYDNSPQFQLRVAVEKRVKSRRDGRTSQTPSAVPPGLASVCGHHPQLKLRAIINLSLRDDPNPFSRLFKN